jgi:uncharacterized protein
MEIEGNTTEHSGDADPPVSVQLSPAQSWLLGPQGLRAGWRLAIYLLLYIVLRFVVLTSARPFFLPHRPSPLWSVFWSECLLALIAIVPAVFMSRLETRPFGDYGLPGRSAFGRDFWAGAVWGFIAFSVLIAVMRGLGLVSFGSLALHGIRILKFAAFWALMFIVVGFREEFLFRGYSLFTLTDGIRFWPAAIVTAACFGGLHLSNSGEDWAGALGAGAIGFFFSFTVRRTGSLWFAIGMHMSWDWGETYFYSVPDSGLVSPGHLMSTSFHGANWLTGGSVGPEGSVLLFILIAIMWFAFDRVYPQKRYPAQHHIETTMVSQKVPPAVRP